MLVLLPPSEGKAEPRRGSRPVDLDGLAYAGELGEVRRRVLAAVDPELERAPAAQAAKVYTGVLFAHLDLGSLEGTALRRARAQVLIASALWGLVRPQDRIPHYKLPIATKVPGLGPLAGLWRPAVTDALGEHRGLVVDCRSGGYAAMWRAPGALHVRAFQVARDGSRKPISHMAKASRGLVARAALTAPRLPRTPQDVAGAAAAAGLEVELTATTLDVLERV